MLPADEFMQLEIIALPRESIASYYRDGDYGFPSRMSFMHPACADSFLDLLEEAGGKVVLTDCWRASKISLKRKYPKGRPQRRGTKAPAHSGHNYGFSIDIDVQTTLDRTGLSKRLLDRWFERYGLFCHRRDHELKSECWHYNILTASHDPDYWMRSARRSTAPALEAMIKREYSEYWWMTKRQIQCSLRKLNYYPGKIDGDLGPKSKRAITAFQRYWHLKPDGVCGRVTGRALAFRCAELRSPLVRNLWTVQ